MDTVKIVVNNKEEYDSKIINNPELCKIHHESGTCKGEPDCSLTHLRLENSSTVMIKNHFRHPSLNKVEKSLQIQSYDLRGIGEKEEQFSLQKSFRRDFEEFYDDLIVKLRAAGSILMFKCCINSVDRLRGNVYVCYEDHECALRAVAMFNGFKQSKWKTMEVALSSVVDWAVSVCNEYIVEGKCGNGRTICTRLHVLSNPRGEYEDNTRFNQMLYPQIYLKQIPLTKNDSNITEEVENSNYRWISNENEPCNVKSKNYKNKVGGNHDKSADEVIVIADEENPSTTECKFYVNLGCCKKGPKCRYRHVIPPPDTTQILIHNFFHHPYYTQTQKEGSELVNNEKEEVEAAYAEFYRDVVERFAALGKIVFFICCRNTTLHLRGNVYIQYADRDAAMEAVNTLDSSMYNGRKLRVEIIPLIDWRSAACRFHVLGRECTYGDDCNFLHMFRNPSNWYALPSIDSLKPLKKRSTALGEPINSSMTECKFYARYGCCKSGPTCRDQHKIPPPDTTQILIHNFFAHPYYTQTQEEDSELVTKCLELAYAEFYRDVIERFIILGEIVFFICCRNTTLHLRGNVYIQYADRDAATEAVNALDGSMHDGRKLRMEFVPLINWRSAACGFHVRGAKCSYGGDRCPFLHMFRNPGNKYDLPPPDSLNFFKNQKTPLCKSYYRSGICLYTSWCRKGHLVSKESTLVLVPNFFKHPKLTKHSSMCGDIREAYRTFYHNFITKFRRVGPVLLWKCLRNRADHLRGNVYVQFSSHDHALDAVKMLQSEGIDAARICHQIQWRNVFCNDKCRDIGSEGDGLCDFLHAFRNPKYEYDRNIPFTNDENPWLKYGSNDVSSSGRVETTRCDGRNTKNGQQKVESIETDGRKSEDDRKTRDNKRKRDTDRVICTDDRVKDDTNDNQRNRNDECKRDHDKRRGDTVSKACNGNRGRKRCHSRSNSVEQHQKHDDDHQEHTGKHQDPVDRDVDQVDNDSYYIVKVTGLPRKLEMEEVLKLFSAYEGIKSVDIRKHSSGSKYPCSAYVVFENKTLADRVLNVLHMVDGQRLWLEGCYM